MRTKVLLVGAKAQPCEGIWVPIAEEGLWSCRVEGFPINGDFREWIDLEILLPSGEVERVSALDEFTGEKVKAIVTTEIEHVEMLSVFVESR